MRHTTLARVTCPGLSRRHLFQAPQMRERPVEMDSTPIAAPNAYGQYGGSIRDSDTDVAGMVGLQQGRPPNRHDTVLSDGSKYSTDE